jgi:hypothetical protein
MLYAPSSAKTRLSTVWDNGHRSVCSLDDSMAIDPLPGRAGRVSLLGSPVALSLADSSRT